ncbi:MAG: phospho-sugar mutase, partial [Puniceicoccales bacterium]|nr:phospho-sugar mutase [Puniceicoccales bacterium]
MACGKQFIADEKGALLPSAEKRVRLWRSAKNLPDGMAKAIDWLLTQGHWSELNDRFFKDLEFGTGGIRGRCVGGTVAPSEGDGAAKIFTGSAVGSNCMNDLNVARAAIALFRHSRSEECEIPSVAIAYDVRHFSRRFAEIVGAIWTLLGGRAFLFDGPRSTPELSFAVRHQNLTAGVVITASHNPYHDNGFKAYSRDGGQMVDPHAAAVMELYGKTSLEEACEILGRCEGGRGEFFPKSLDDDYVHFLRKTIVDPLSMAAIGRRPIVYTSLHGAGIAITEQLIRSTGLPICPVAGQCNFDPNFSTVPSPNPENGAAFSVAIAYANEIGADLAIAADPDADRMALAYRNRTGKMECLSGNRTAVLLAERRLHALFVTGKITAETASHCVLIRSLVTTPLLDAVAKSYGIKVVFTPVGFKWIGAKLEAYERTATQKLGLAFDYRRLDEGQRRSLLLKNSTYFVMGAEESCGYMALDGTRDKDSHSALLMACEAYGSLLREGITIDDFFDRLHRRFGYHDSRTFSIQFPGTDGLKKIETLMKSLKENSYETLCDREVVTSSDL